MQLRWTHHGPGRATSIEVPPRPSLIESYALGYDEALERIFYLCKPDDGSYAAVLYTFDGAAWHRETKDALRMEHSFLGGAYDSCRRAVVGWTVTYDRTAERWRVNGLSFAAGGASPVAAHGDEPLIEPENESDALGTFDKQAMLAFDRRREVWVCVTRRGVWELDGDGAWTKRADTGPIPQAWQHESGVGVYDPLNERAVFLVQGKADKYALVVLTWNGTTLEKLSMAGLPKLTIGLFDPIVAITGHPKHGTVLHAGGNTLFAATDSGWKPLAETCDPPPKMTKAHLAFDPKRDALMLGPGKHEGAGGSEYAAVFFVLQGDAWTKQGVSVVHSPIAKASYGNARVVHANGDWYALGTHSLQTWRYTGSDWATVTSKEDGEKLGGWELSELVDAEGRLHAVMATGAVFSFDGSQWAAVANKDAAFKERTDFALAAAPDGRILVWGGEAKGRKLNDTLLFEKGRWRAVKKASPQPADFKHGKKDDIYVDTHAIFDSALGTFVRFGFEDVAVLGADEVWEPIAPKGYKENVGPRRWGHVPVHDAESGETLLIDFQGTSPWDKPASRPAQVLRFDLGRCVPLATIEYPAELAPKKQHDPAAFHALAQTFSYDAKTRALYAQVKEDATGTYRLDLGPLFDKAKALGPRTLPKGGTSKATAPTRFYRVKPGALAKLEVATSERNGFVRAADLSRDDLVALVGVRSCELVVGKPTRAGSPSASRVGGSPSVPTAKWPKLRKKPMGFLFQLETGELLKKHAGIAVFCALDGEATNEPEENVVVLLDRAALAKMHEPPDGVPTLPMRPLRAEAPKIEIDEERAQALGASDPELGAALERLASAKGLQATNVHDKLGGLPGFLQGDVPMKGHKLVAQLDFDAIPTAKEWPDAALSGCVYVFVRDDEKSATAFWQYT